MNVGDLEATFNVDIDESGFARAEAAMEGLRRSADGRLRDLRGRFVSESRLMGDALRDGIRTADEAIEGLGDADVTIDVDVDPTGAEEGIAEVEVDLDELRRRTAETAASIRRDLSAALRRLPAVRIDADSTELDERLVAVRQQLRDLAAERVGITITTEEAERRLAALTAELEALSREHPSPQVNLGVRQAAESIVDLRRRLAELSGESVDIRVDVEASRARAEIAEVREEARGAGDDGDRAGRLLSSIGDAAGPIGSVAGRIAMVGGAVGGVVPLVAGLGAALVSILPAAGLAATGLLAVASAGAAIKIGASGVGSAIKAAFADAPAAAGAASGAANQYANAQRAVKDAVENAAYANEQAVRHVADAERNLADAQKASLQAQQALDDVRHQAAQDLEDLNNKLADAGLSQRDAVLRVQDAQDALTAATAEGSTATERQRQQAQLAYDQAVQRLREQGVSYARLQQQAEQANAAGVDGSQKVVQAQDRIAQAQRQVQDQTRALQDAQVQQTRTAAQGAEQVQRAIEALHQAGAGAAAGGVDPLAAALAKLSPNARAFVEQLIALKPALSDLKFDVQQALFDNFAGSLRTGATSVLPVLHTALVGSAQQLNAMAKSAVAAAVEMSDNGTLGKAFASANKGLGGLTRLPAVFIQGVAQIGAAAGPAFERLGAAAGGGLDKLSQKLTGAFNSGGMQRAIETAIDLLGQLGTAVGNVGRFIGEVLGAAQQSGGGFVNTLVVISGALAAAFADPAIQSGLQALFHVTASLASAAAPLLISALKVVAPVLTALGPPVQVLIAALGAGLQPIIVALGPVLLAAAQAVGGLLQAIAPLFPVVGQLIAMIGPILTPIIAAVGQIFAQLAPIIAQVGQIIAAVLQPVLAALPVVLQPVLDLITMLTGILLPVLGDLLSILSPALGQLGQAFGQIMVALAPVLTQLGTLLGEYLRVMLPLLTPIITAVAQLAALFAGQLASAIQNIVVPAFRMISQILSGDFSGALQSGKEMLVGLAQTMTDIFVELPGKIGTILGDLATSMFDAGKKLINSLVDGIKSVAGKVKDTISDLVGGIADFFPHSPAKTGPFSGRGYPLYSGQAIGLALAEGMASSQDRVRAATASLMGTANGGLGLGQLAVAGAGMPGGGAAGGLRIEHYHEAAAGNARSTAEELEWLRRGRG